MAALDVQDALGTAGRWNRSPLQQLHSVALVEVQQCHADKVAAAQPSRALMQALRGRAMQTHWQRVSPHSIALQYTGSRPWALSMAPWLQAPGSSAMQKQLAKQLASPHSSPVLAAGS